MKHAPNCSGSRRLNTRPKVSWEGMPLGSLRNLLSHSSLAWPNSSTSTQLSAPQITAQMVEKPPPSSLADYLIPAVLGPGRWQGLHVLNIQESPHQRF